jgi:hypothetical protein
MAFFRPVRAPFPTFGLAVALLIASFSSAALATPRPLPFSYPAETLPKESLELEQIVDVVPVRVAREEVAGSKAVTSLRWELLTEFEYGLTDKVEIALYFAFRQAASATSPYFQFRGIKQRVRWEISDQSYWPLGLGVYGEIAEYHDELEFEEKILLSRHFGPIGVQVNLWVEQEYYFQDDDWRFIYNPTAGGYYEFSPHFTLGAEYWARGRFGGGGTATAAAEDAPNTTKHYAGPTAMLQRGEYFVSAGGYLRLDHLSESVGVGDAWGRFYGRLMLGLHL